MKNVFFSAFLLGSLVLNGQGDVIFFEKFDTDIASKMTLFPSGDDTTWVNFDADGISPIDPNLPGNWFWDIFQTDFSSGTVVDSAFASTSFLVGGLPGNKNWLISPPIFIPDSTCRLFWKSASFQGPAFHDGYKILISTETNFDYHFIDTVFQQGQMTDFTDDCSVNLDDFTFSKGSIHANGYLNSDYFETLTDPTGCMVNLGKLEPHSTSLSKFAGQKIYVAFLHDSDDDYVLELDDIRVLKNQTSAAREPFLCLVFSEVSPNPTSRFLNLKMELSRSESMSYALFDALGRDVFSKKMGEKSAGKTAFVIDLEPLERGVYFLKMQVGENVFSKTIFKI